MKTLKIITGILLLSTIVNCGPKLSKDDYVGIMASLGCADAMENTPEGEALLQYKGVTQASINEFRQKTKPEVMTQVIGEIASKVIACHESNDPLDKVLNP